MKYEKTQEMIHETNSLEYRCSENIVKIVVEYCERHSIDKKNVNDELIIQILDDYENSNLWILESESAMESIREDIYNLLNKERG